MRVFVTLTGYNNAKEYCQYLLHYTSAEQLIEYEGIVDFKDISIEELNTINNRNLKDNISYN